MTLGKAKQTSGQGFAYCSVQQYTKWEDMKNILSPTQQNLTPHTGVRFIWIMHCMFQIYKSPN